MVDEIFSLFSDWAEEVLRYAVAQLSYKSPRAFPPLNASAHGEDLTNLSSVM
jgi:hypothetical protein